MAEPETNLSLSGEDIVKLQTATFLTLSSVLSDAGVIRLADLATILAAHVDTDDHSVGAQIIQALAAVLAGGRSARTEPGQMQKHGFAVITGGCAAPMTHSNTEAPR